MSEAPGTLDWQRVHWATPWVRSGVIVVAIVTALLAQVMDDIIRAVTTPGDGEGVSGLAWVMERGWALLAAGGIVVVVLALVALSSWLVWRSIRFAVDADAVYLRKGILSRQQRKARLDRVQSIDINQPFLARIFGLASLTFDVAGGKDSDVTIEFLTKGRAEGLREELLSRVREQRGVAPGTGGSAADDGSAPPGNAATPDDGSVPPRGPAAAEEPAAAPHGRGEARPGAKASSSSRLISRAAEAAAGNLEDLAEDLAALFGGYRVRPGIGPDGQLFRLNLRRLLVSLLLSGGAILTALIVVGILVAGIVTGSWVALAWALPAVAAGGGYLVKTFVDEAHFTVRLSRDGVVVSRGLTTTVRRIIPLDRIQAVGFSQPLLWRRLGWWRVNFNTAATSTGEEGSAANSVILPVGNRDDVLAIMALVLPNPGVTDGAALVDEAMNGTGEGGGFVAAPARSRILDPLQFRRNGYAITDTCVVTRRGALTRVAEWVPHARVQSLGLRQGPIQRSRDLATVALHSTQGPVTPTIHHCDAEGAFRFLAEQSERSRAARGADASPEREHQEQT